MPFFKNWICIYTSDSLIEANLIRSYLESRKIPVTIYSIPNLHLHDYLHDKNEQIRIFVQAANPQEVRASIQKLILANRQDFSEINGAIVP